jgi:hypothetical protein
VRSTRPHRWLTTGFHVNVSTYPSPTLLVGHPRGRWGGGDGGWLQVGWYGQAVEHYKRTHGVLRKYSSIPSFRTILQECDEIVATLRLRLRLVLESNVPTPPTPTPAAAGCCCCSTVWTVAHCMAIAACRASHPEPDHLIGSQNTNRTISMRWLTLPAC